ncbi:MAG: hypothetical protein ACHP7N_09200 [Caulobacterales bacterium]
MVRIELTEAVGSKDRRRGDKFAIRLAAPIVVDGRTLAPAGSSGMGEVVYGERGSWGGAPGKLVLAARYIDVGDIRVHLKAFNLAAGGDSQFNELRVEAAIAGEIAGVAGAAVVLLIDGKDVVYPVGTRAHAKVAEDVFLPAGAPAAEAESPPASPNTAAPSTPPSSAADATPSAVAPSAAPPSAPSAGPSSDAVTPSAVTATTPAQEPAK